MRIDIAGVHYTYPTAQARALDEIDLTLEGGGTTLLVGPSGGGKTTLCRALAGAVPHLFGGTFGGTITLHRGGGATPLHIPQDQPQALAGTVALGMQDPEAQLVRSTVDREVAFGLEQQGLPPAMIERRVEEALALLELPAEGDVASLSGGEQQRVVLAGLLAMHPSLLVLDEPTSQLDPKSAEELLLFVRRLNEDLGLTVVLAEQRLERCLPFVDRVIQLEAGRVVADAPPTAFATSQLRATDPQASLLPPVCRLAALGLPSVPISVKEARQGIEGILAASGGALKMAPSATATPRKGETILQVRQLRFRYAAHTPLLEGIDLRVDAGEVLCLLGRNGAGKSTLLQVIAGLHAPDAGTISVGGTPNAHQPVSALARSCALLLQDPRAYAQALRVDTEVLESLGDLRLPPRRAESRTAAVLTTLGLEGVAERDPRDLSGGQVQRVALASVLVRRRPLLLLDEPTRGLDYALKGRLATTLRRYASPKGTPRRAVVLVSHDVELAAIAATRVAILGRGRIIADGPPAEVLGDSLLFSPQVSRVVRGLLKVEGGTGIVRPEQLRLAPPLEGGS